MSKKSSTFAPAFEKQSYSLPLGIRKEEQPGAVVQLVRIPACHAVGREFESRPHRLSFNENTRIPVNAGRE